MKKETEVACRESNAPSCFFCSLFLLRSSQRQSGLGARSNNTHTCPTVLCGTNVAGGAEPSNIIERRRSERASSDELLAEFFCVCGKMLSRKRGKRKRRKRRRRLSLLFSQLLSKKRSFRAFFSSFSHHGEVRPGPYQRVQELQGSRQVRRKEKGKKQLLLASLSD